MSKTRRGEAKASTRWYQFSLRALLLCPAVLGLVMALLWCWPKSRVLEIHPSYVAEYRGLGLTRGSGLLGRSYFRITFPTGPDLGLVVVDFDAPGYNKYTAYYPNGALRERGECLVETDALGDELYPNDHHVLWCKCYKPDGSLGSEVRNGTGVQTRWATDDRKLVEIQLRDGVWERYRLWYPNGRLQVRQCYSDGELHGPATYFYPNGAKKAEGRYEHGVPVGRWLNFNEDGSPERVDESGQQGAPRRC